jgi:hypothetical protein
MRFGPAGPDDVNFQTGVFDLLMYLSAYLPINKNTMGRVKKTFRRLSKVMDSVPKNVKNIFLSGFQSPAV